MGRKEIRQAQIMQVILETGQIPNGRELKECFNFNVSDRTLRKDIQQICDAIPEIDIEMLRNGVFKRINTRIRDDKKPMADKNLINILSFFMSRKQELTVDAEVVTSIKPIMDWESLDEDERRKLIDAARVFIKRKRDSEEESTSIH